MKRLLPNDIDIDNEVNSESEEDAPATFSIEPIVAFLNDPDCNNLTENEGNWVLNENVAFNYSLCLEYILKSIDINSLYMPLAISEMVCMHIKDNEGSVVIVPPSKRDQSLTIFGRGQDRAMTPRESDDNLEPPQFFHYMWSARRMMKGIGYSLNCRVV